MTSHLNYPEEFAFKTNRVRKGQKRKDRVSSLCPNSWESASVACLSKDAEQQHLWRTATHIHRFQKWICIAGTQMGRQQINLPDLSSNRRQHCFLSYCNMMHNSTTLQSCLLYTWTLKLRETFVQKPNLVWTCSQSSEEIAIPHRDFSLPLQRREEKNADSESCSPILLLCVTVVAFREFSLQAQKGKLTLSCLWQ